MMVWCGHPVWSGGRGGDGERGCPSLSLPPAPGEVLHPGNPFPIPTGLVSHNMGLQDPRLIVLFFAEDEPPQQLFLLKLVLESNAGCSGGTFSLWGDFSDVEDSSQRKYNYSLRFSRSED